MVILNLYGVPFHALGLSMTFCLNLSHHTVHELNPDINERCFTLHCLFIIKVRTMGNGMKTT